MKRKAETTRRDFLKAAGSAAAVSALADVAIPHVYAAQDVKFKLGLIGCGGRGTGAAGNALTPDRNKDAVLWAMADLFPENLESSRKSLTAMFGDRVQVPPERRFTGFDGYRGVIENCDVVLVCVPPRFTSAMTLADCAMTCVLGQLAIYTGRQLTWKEALESQFAYLPDGDVTWDTEPPVKPGPDGLYPVLVPGQTALKSRFA